MINMSNKNKQYDQVRMFTFRMEAYSDKRERNIRIWLPEDYDGNKKYPVIYMHDGQNLFNDGGNYSKWYVDKVTKRFYGKPFHQTIKSMRMWHAKALMVYKHSLIKISKHCGYTDYSAFYRAYTSFFGVSPKNEYQYYLKNKSFLSDKKNNTITNLD